MKQKGKVIQVLLIDEKDSDYRKIKNLIDQIQTPKILLTHEKNSTQALASMKQDLFDVYLIDDCIGTISGIDLLKKARRSNPSIVAIFLSDEADHLFDLTAMKAGAVDYLIKNHFSSSQIERSIRYAIHDKHIEKNLEKRVKKRTQELLDLNDHLTREIAKRKKTEKALRENTQRLELAQKAGKIGMFDWNLLTNAITLSNEMASVYGHSIDTIGKDYETWIHLIHTEDRERTENEIKYAISTGNDLATEYRVIASDKSTRFITARAQVLRDRKRNPTRMVGVNIDITDRKLIENAMSFLAEASTILNSSLDYETTLKTIAELVTPQFADWCAIDMVSEDKQIERLAVTHKDPEKLERVKDFFRKNPSWSTENSAIKRAISTKKSEFYPFISEEMIQNASHSPQYREIIQYIGFSSVMIVPLIVNKTAIGAMTFVLADSGRHFSIIDLSTAEELANRAALAIQNARLYQNAELGIKTRDEFLNIASHELKTPLTSLQLQLQILKKRAKTQEKVGPSDLTRFLNVEELQLKRLTKLINNLLDVSRIHGNHLELEREEVDLGEIVEETVQRFEELLQNENIDLRIDLERQIIGYWDKFKIDQAITNLLSNAVKYGKNNPIDIRVYMEKGVAYVEVQDRGIGMEDTEMDKIFKRFGRTETAKNYDGLGLGLYISSQFIQAHGGSIYVKSHPDRGSTFTILLPVAN